ncbi:DNA polymerase-4 [Microlunatus sagamiharensis]|uniref:DNA polymerase IV n=1 Tax=Microlunatus sagamiharensis TaxID=546874 RepID=A0A1H2LPY3_9ACTN|nr:DNA polymerase IV [Microlunatus sagamiharensis]SDU82825.1 DNA polymerase-4 [Microlunatus sagamiharensis]
MRREASVLHLDLDAFYASVEQRDKPSLRGKPVVVGGVGQRGVVATASYEARVFGVRSAMPSHEARRRCPNAAFLVPRFDVYKVASGQVMGLLRALSPLVEPLSLDEAFVDLRASPTPLDLSPDGLRTLLTRLKDDVHAATSGLTASVGAASSKFLAKIASELEKPDGLTVVEPGTEVERIGPMSVGVIFGVGPVTRERLDRIGVRTVADLRQVEPAELAQVVGRAHAESLAELAWARDDRPVEAEREAKSISVEDTFATDVKDRVELAEILRRDARQVASRLVAAQLFARTVTIKVRRPDFSTITRARTLRGATDRAEVITAVAQSLLDAVEVTGGVRLLGVGVAGLTDLLQDDLFAEEETGSEEAPDDDAEEATPAAVEPAQPPGSTEDHAYGPPATGWAPGLDVEHDEHGPGWVWGAGVGRVTVRFETRDTAPGPVRTFAEDDPALRRRDATRDA